jgi:hypothetical protein
VSLKGKLRVLERRAAARRTREPTPEERASAWAEYEAARDAWDEAATAGRDPGPLPRRPGARPQSDREAAVDRNLAFGHCCLLARVQRRIGPLDYLANMSPGAMAYCDRFCGTLWSMDADPHLAAGRPAGEPPEFPEWEVYAAAAQLPTDGSEVGLEHPP